MLVQLYDSVNQISRDYKDALTVVKVLLLFTCNTSFFCGGRSVPQALEIMENLEKSPCMEKSWKGEFQICPRMDFCNILYVEYLCYNNYKTEIILLIEGC